MRASSTKRSYPRKKEMLDMNWNNPKQYTRAMSAQVVRYKRNTKPFIHKVYLSSKNRVFYQNHHIKKEVK